MPIEFTIDARWLHTGIGTYTLNLLSALARRKNGFTLHALTVPSEVGRLSAFCDRVTAVDTPIYTLREQWHVPRAACKTDLLHVPHYNVPILHRGKLVTTILDLIHLIERQDSLAKRLYA